MARRVPDGPPPPPVVQRIRLRYAKRGRLRFTSHRDFARAFERALRRAELPMAYSAGFSPHPKVSYIGAAPTGVASEAEYVEIGLAAELDVDSVRERLDAALPDGLDIVDAVAAGPDSLADRMQASAWRIELAGVSREQCRAAVELFLAREELSVERLTKNGRRAVDVRGAVQRLAVTSTGTPDVRAILDVVVRQVTPTVRPDDVVAGLRDVAGLAPSGPPLAVRLAQGPVGVDGTIGDPLAADRDHAATPSARQAHR
ncbi:MAG TPA: TIGR03936 family radical SAM-associated protein [Jatrophihabitans sp.]|nr:TIGR03936 family radical SAM-associated protein [Jatrophihabitans sp.]